jgi:hypothetical protein
MFDNYLLVDGSARAVEVDGQPAFEVGTRIAYYRGLGLSMVEDVAITLDGRPLPRELTTLTVGGKTYTLAEMETVTDDRWGFSEVATIRVPTEHPVSLGEHQVGVTERLRISYMPVTSVTSCTKVMTVGSSDG